MSTVQRGDDDPSDIEAIDALVERALSGEPLDDHLAKLPPAIAREADVLLEAEKLFAGSSSVRPDVAVRDRPATGTRSVPEGTGRVGSYVLIELIGRGGQGEVWLAIDERLGRRVALKLLNDRSVFSAEARRRLLREAAVTSQLDHPGICTVHEVGEEAGVPFIAMRLVEGRTVDRLFRAAAKDDQEWPSADTRPDSDARHADAKEIRLPAAEEIRRLLLVFEEAARALHLAHEAGVVHRDIKPRNIMVTESGQAVLLDFGLASHEKIEASLTRTGDLFGTPAYMAPEQLSGGSAGADRRTDVWSPSTRRSSPRSPRIRAASTRPWRET
jgi:serine/threonine protein kinase